MARLAALVPTPRVNLTRYHGVFAPNHRWREQVTLARRGRRKTEAANETAPARHVSMTWAQRLKRVFKIDIETCEHCGGAVKVIASIEDLIVIKKILEHFDRRAEPATSGFTPVARAPELGIASLTVAKHRFNMINKLGLETTVELARYARANGFTLSARRNADGSLIP